MPGGIRLSGVFRASLLIAVALGALSYVDVSMRQREEGQMRAVIFDPLFSDDPGLHIEMADLLAARGYAVTSVTSANATPRALATLGRCDVLVLRVHSTCSRGEVWLFTGEEYSPDRYVIEQVADEVHRARPSLESRHVFAVGSTFVSRFMADSLKGTVVLLMGCDGLKSEDLAAAFTGCGASAYVSWDGPVSLPHTDLAFLRLVEALTAKRMSLGEATAYANGAVGPDPEYNSTLHIYPEAAAHRRIG
jgi:hypothetical protein